MKTKKIFIIFLIIFSSQNFSQSDDSTYISPFASDTLKDFNSSLADSTILYDSLKVLGDSTIADTTGLLSDSIAVTDTLVPLNTKPFYNYSNFISRNEILMNNYRYSGDLLDLGSFTFMKDYGFIGHPDEILVYGSGMNTVSYFQDGILVNDRYNNELNLNLIQSESIDSIEIIPSPRGFLYGLQNNPVSVNFISRDFISAAPYTRIKYYEGPGGEAMFDGTFNALFLGSLNGFFEITNRNVDETFKNSEFSIWQMKAGIKYFLNNNINFIASYNYDDYESGLNGGVNVDSILRITSNIDSLLFNSIEAPVYNLTRLLEVKRHRLSLKTLSKVGKTWQSDLSLYYNFTENYINEEEGKTIISKNKVNTFGAFFRNNFTAGIFNLELNGNYENNEVKRYSDNSHTSQIKNEYSISTHFSASLFSELLIPSVFFKYNNTSLFDFNGYGFDLIYNLNNYIIFYSGYSKINFNKNIFKPSESMEVSAKFISSSFTGNIIYFRRSNMMIHFPKTFLGIYSFPVDLSGLSLNLNYQLWKILLEAKADYYNVNDAEIYPNNIPDFTFNGGIYYKDILFNENLNLKTGFKIFYSGEREFFYPTLNIDKIPSVYRIDFTLAGEIQKTAIVYFTWENLLDEDYYIVPFYPMPERNIRFGVAWELFN